jgi:outer membrane protein assembly factor BamB
VNALDGAPLWRFQMSTGGINASPVIYKDMVISVHGTENLDSTEEGRMVAIRIPDNYDAGEELVLGAESEVWRNGICMFTSSPVLVGDRVYQITKTGTLACVNADTGEILWEEKLATSNLHSSPLAVGELLLRNDVYATFDNFNVETLS